MQRVKREKCERGNARKLRGRSRRGGGEKSEKQ